jgi:hypothetical protein
MRHYTKAELAIMQETQGEINPVRIHTLAHPSPLPPFSNDTPVPDKRRNGTPRRRSYSATVAGRIATTHGGKMLVWGNQALARADMLALLR